MESYGTSSGGSGTPLVVSFDAAPVRFTHATGAFDLMGEQASFDSDWVSARTPWLAMDRDGNGAIDDGRELFGSMTILASGRRAPNGFVALAELDDDGDGRITPADASFSRLLLWSDANQDRHSSPDELRTVAEAGVLSLDLGYDSEPRCTPTACEIERAAISFRDGADHEARGAIVDVHLAAQ
jgi:hypothetical protein